MKKYIPPTYKGNCYNCPICYAYAQQIWISTQFVYHIHPQRRSQVEGSYNYGNEEHFELEISRCVGCGKAAIWRDGKMIFPNKSTAPHASSDMPLDIAKDFEEARNVFAHSPRATAALLRLALQKLCKELGQAGENINHDIGELVKQGLSPRIQKSLDIIRVIGNNAVHPGEINLNEDASIALALFDLINLIVEDMITRPRLIDEMYSKSPEEALQGIERRDKKSSI